MKTNITTTLAAATLAAAPAMAQDTAADTHGTETARESDGTKAFGFEVGPKDIGLGGLTGNSGLRLRGEASTLGWVNSFRPTLGLVAHF